MSLVVENDILKRFCDKCGKEWGFGTAQKASILGNVMVEKIKSCQFYCIDCSLPTKNGFKIMTVAIPKNLLIENKYDGKQR